MNPATWFKKAKTPEAVSAKNNAADAAPAPAAVVEAPAPAPSDETVKVEAVKIEAGQAERPAAAAGAGFRASRLVDAGRKSSTTLMSRLTTARKQAEPWGKPAGVAAALLVAGALGYAGGYASAGKGSAEDVAALRWSEAAASISENRQDVARLAAEMKSVRSALDGLRSERRTGDSSAKQAQLIERSGADTAAKIAKLAEQLDRIEKTQRDPARIGAIVDRLERIEKQVQTASLITSAPKPMAAAAPPIDVTATGSLPADARPPARPAEVDLRKVQAEGYALRDVEDGFALVEARNGRFFEVAPGMSLPGLGRVEAIERRGRQWVVVTPKGYVAER